MSTERFELDINKAISNEIKHKVTFVEATGVFHDDYAIYLDDPEHSLNEERFLILGVSSESNILMVCYCMRESDTIIRIISAREATKHEKNKYYNQ